MTWPNVVAVGIVAAMTFFMAWQAPLVLVLLIGAMLYLMKTTE